MTLVPNPGYHDCDLKSVLSTPCLYTRLARVICIAIARGIPKHSILSPYKMMGSRTLGLQDMAGHITISKILTQAGSFHDLVPKKEVILTLFAGPLIALFLFWKCDEAKVGSLRLFPTLLLPEPLGAAAPKKDFMVLRSAVTQHAALASTARNRSSLKDTTQYV